MSNVNVILNSVSKPLNSEQTLNSVAERVVCAEGTHSEVSTPLCSSCTCIVEQIYFSLELIFSFHSLLPTVQSQEAVKGRGNIHHWIGYVGYIIGYFFFPEICFTALLHTELKSPPPPHKDEVPPPQAVLTAAQVYF